MVWVVAGLLGRGRETISSRNELQTKFKPLKFQSMIRRNPPTIIEGGGALIDVRLSLDGDALNPKFLFTNVNLNPTTI